MDAKQVVDHYERKMKRTREKMIMLRRALQKHAIDQDAAAKSFQPGILNFARDIDAVNLLLDDALETLRRKQ